MIGSFGIRTIRQFGRLSASHLFSILTIVGLVLTIVRAGRAMRAT